MLGRGIAIFAICSAFGAVSAHADPLHYDWRLEDGAEYDSNPARVETIAGVWAHPAAPGSPLARIVASGSLVGELGTRNTLALSGALGGKWFTDSETRAENVWVAQATASDSVKIACRTELALSGSYYDVFQRRSIDLPDFRSLAPALRIEQGLFKSLRISLAAGYRWFDFKPDASYGFHAPTAAIGIWQILPGDLMTGGADWDWSAGASVEDRGFQGLACTSTGCDQTGTSPRHHDDFWIAHAEFSRTSSWLFGAGAAMHVNQSNSYGEALVRGLVHMRAVVPLPWDLSLSARGELVATRYRDQLTFLEPVAGLPGASIEDESRSTFRVDLARLVEKRFEIGGRYVYYTSAPSSGTLEYRRQTVLVYLAFLDER